jgi:hypothetical protein
MTEELPNSLLELIHATIPTPQAAEALLFLAANRDRDFNVEEIVVGMRPKVITADAMEEYGALFAAARLVTSTNGRIRYDPVSTELERRVCELWEAYNERPVSLIITIHQMADGSI